ncbi:MAG TPA: amidohydrolase family protein, partial [Dehalococcoidia bacterium]|nr:amidohydrolase family protein [Dehalococcoidia bacterium]
MPWSAVPLVLHNATLIDGTGADPRPAATVVVEGRSIVRIASAREFALPRDAEIIDLQGRFLLPGLTDAHVHFGLTEPDGTTTRPLAAYALKVARFIEEALDQGFTTVRDAGGLDPAWAG